MTYFLALDQGTSSSRGMIFDATGTTQAVYQQPFEMQFPQDGWVEQDPEVLWHTTVTAGQRALAACPGGAKGVVAIGITNQRETTLVWDRQTGQCVYPAIVWQDRRTAARCEQMQAEGLALSIAASTGLVIDPYFSATKLAWILDNVAGARSRAEQGELCFGTVDSFLIWRLTGGVHKTDATNASRTQLYDINHGEWDAQLLEYLQIPTAVLPEVCDSVGLFGVTEKQHFGRAIPIVGVAGDQQAALIGQGCVQPLMSKCTYGTGCFAMTNTGANVVRSKNQLLSTIAYQLDGVPTYALEGSVFAAGIAVQWLRDQLQLIAAAPDTELSARKIQGDTQGVYVVPAFTGLGAPYWNPHARGLITGLTLDSNRDHLVTATLASVVYQTADLLTAMAGDQAPVAQLRIDGGMVANTWLCQFIADLLDLPVRRPLNTETTALGAALLAAVGSAEVSSLTQAASAMCHADVEGSFTPQMDAAVRERLIAGWQAAVAQAQH